MNFYVLPKSNAIVNLFPTMTSSLQIPYQCASYYNIFMTLIQQIKKGKADIDHIIKIINPFLPVYQVTHIKQKCPISKLNLRNPYMYCFIEIINNLRNYAQYKFIGQFSEDFQLFTDLRRHSNFYGNQSQVMFCYNISCDQFSSQKSYIQACVNILDFIANNLEPENGFIVNIDHLFIKPVLEFLFVLTTLFSKVSIVKPSISNQSNFEKFIVCQDLQHINIKDKMNSMKNVIYLSESNLIPSSLITNNIPSIFTNKIDDIHVILGQQQLESLQQVFNVSNSKNLEEKLESIQKQSIQKSSQWCENNDIPSHRFVDRINLFKENLHVEDTFANEIVNCAVSEEEEKI